jgi:hypothetical protein
MKKKKKKKEKKKRHQPSLHQQVKEAMIILRKGLYKDYLKLKESSRYVFTTVKAPLEQKYNIYNVKNLPFIKREEKKKRSAFL